jgi:hypothetical protein
MNSPAKNLKESLTKSPSYLSIPEAILTTKSTALRRIRVRVRKSKKNPPSEDVSEQEEELEKNVSQRNLEFATQLPQQDLVLLAMHVPLQGLAQHLKEEKLPKSEPDNSKIVSSESQMGLSTSQMALSTSQMPFANSQQESSNTAASIIPEIVNPKKLDNTQIPDITLEVEEFCDGHGIKLDIETLSNFPYSGANKFMTKMFLEGTWFYGLGVSRKLSKISAANQVGTYLNKKYKPNSDKIADFRAAENANFYLVHSADNDNNGYPLILEQDIDKEFLRLLNATKDSKTRVPLFCSFCSSLSKPVYQEANGLRMKYCLKCLKNIKKSEADRAHKVLNTIAYWETSESSF